MEDNMLPMEMFGVRLRVPRKSTDFDECLAGANDPYVQQFLRGVMPVYEDEEEGWFSGMSKRVSTDIIFAIELVGEQPVYVGNIGLHRMSSVDRTASTGTVIWSRDHQSRGIGTKAKMLLLNYAFNGLNLRKINSSVVAFNERSLRYSLRCGYREEGRLKDQLFRNGKYYDQVFLGLFREDWEPLWEKFKMNNGCL